LKQYKDYFEKPQEVKKINHIKGWSFAKASMISAAGRETPNYYQ